MFPSTSELFDLDVHACCCSITQLMSCLSNKPLSVLSTLRAVTGAPLRPATLQSRQLRFSQTPPIWCSQSPTNRQRPDLLLRSRMIRSISSYCCNPPIAAITHSSCHRQPQDHRIPALVAPPPRCLTQRTLALHYQVQNVDKTQRLGIAVSLIHYVNIFERWFG